MLALRFVLLLAVGLSLGVVYPSADSWAATAKKGATTKKMKASFRGKSCYYHCPPNEYVCADPPPDDNGCMRYTCVEERPGSDSCPD